MNSVVYSEPPSRLGEPATAKQRQQLQLQHEGSAAAATPGGASGEERARLRGGAAAAEPSPAASAQRRRAAAQQSPAPPVHAVLRHFASVSPGGGGAGRGPTPEGAAFIAALRTAMSVGSAVSSGFAAAAAAAENAAAAGVEPGAAGYGAQAAAAFAQQAPPPPRYASPERGIYGAQWGASPGASISPMRRVGPPMVRQFGSPYSPTSVLAPWAGADAPLGSGYSKPVFRPAAASPAAYARAAAAVAGLGAPSQQGSAPAAGAAQAAGLRRQGVAAAGGVTSSWPRAALAL